MSVMLRCQCGHEVTVPEEATAGLVSCPVCHGAIDPAKSVVHPSLDDLDPELLLAPDDDFSAAPAPAPSPASASVSADDDFLGLADFDSASSSNEAGLPFDVGHSTRELPVDLDLGDDAVAADDREVPDDLLGSAPAEILPASPAVPSVQPPADDDEGYAIVEEDFGKRDEAPSWLNPAAELPPNESDEIQIADDSAKATRPAAKPPTKSAESTRQPAATSSKSATHDPFADLLDDEIHIAPEEKPPVPETPAECPECKAALKPGSQLCITCGYNLKTGQKMQAAPDAKGKGTKAKSAKAKATGDGAGAAWKDKLKEPRILLAAGGGGVVLLALVGWLLFGGGEEPKPVATQSPATPATPSGPETPEVPTNPNANAPSGEVSAPVPADPSRPTLVGVPSGVQGKVASFAFSADGKLLAIGDENGSVTLWDIEKGEARPPLAMGISGPVQVAFSADARQLLAGFSGGAKLWDIEPGTAREFKSPVDGLFAVRFAPGGERFFTSGPTGIFSMVDLAAGGRVTASKVPLPPGIQPVVAITPDGKFGVVGADEGLLLVLDLSLGRPVAQLKGHTSRVTAVAISPDGRYALSTAGGPEYRTIGDQRYLMSSRPTDVGVRVWDISTGKELWRLHTPPEKSVLCLAFAPDGKTAAIVTDEVRLINVDTKQQIAQIVPAKPGAASVPEALVPPTEPFRLAAFFPDGKRIVTACQNAGIHIWSLPEQPERKPLPGISEPADLASLKLASSAPITPLLIPATAAKDDPATAERLATATKAAEVTAGRIPVVAKLREVLASKPRTPEWLLKFSKACRGKELYLEAEECLRAALMADPTNEVARQEYEELKSLGPKGTGPISLARAWVKPVPDLEDAGVRPDPPRNAYVVSLPIDVAVVDRFTKLDGGTLVGKAGDKEADFLGIHHRATGEITGARKKPGGGGPATGQLQIWEAMAVAHDKKSDKKVVQFSNRRVSVQDQPRAGAAGAGEPKVKSVPDTSKVKEDYQGPYEALFAVPDGETLSEIRWEDTLPVRVLGEEPKSLDALALDTNADLSQRLAAIEALGISPTPDAADTLLKLIADGDDKLFEASRAALRGVRRRGNLVSPEYLPTPDADTARLIALSFGTINGNEIAQAQSSSFGQPSGAASSLPVNSNYSYCKTLWNLNMPGRYLARVAMFGEPPTYSKQLTLEFELTATEPNLYVALAKVDRADRGEVQVVELWRDNKPVERRILSASPWAASSIAARLPLEPPVRPKQDEAQAASPQFGGSSPSADGSPEMLRDVFPGTLTPAYVAPIFGSQPSALLPVERAVLEALVTSLPADAQPAIPAALAEVARLDVGNALLTKAAIDKLKQLPGETPTSLFIRLSETASPPAAIAAIEALHDAGSKSAAACRTLIDLQSGPADLRKPAEDAVNDLMTQGIIAHEGSNWRYHGETHFPEEPKEEPKPNESETASP